MCTLYPVQLPLYLIFLNSVTNCPGTQIMQFYSLQLGGAHSPGNQNTLNWFQNEQSLFASSSWTRNPAYLQYFRSSVPFVHIHKPGKLYDVRALVLSGTERAQSCTRPFWKHRKQSISMHRPEVRKAAGIPKPTHIILLIIWLEIHNYCHTLKFLSSLKPQKTPSLPANGKRGDFPVDKMARACISPDSELMRGAYLQFTTRLRGLAVNPLTLELNPSAQRCLPRFFIGDFNF
jgi:hypothetical protein